MFSEFIKGKGWKKKLKIGEEKNASRDGVFNISAISSFLRTRANDEPAGWPATRQDMLDCKTRPNM